jgi:hypothetical protein
MKKILKRLNVFLVSAIAIFCLTGCVRFNTTINVKSNGKVDVSMLYAAMDMSDYGYDTEALTDEQKQEYLDDGWDVVDYNQDGFSGFMISKNDVTADELASSLNSTQSELGESGSLSFTKQGHNYVLDWQVFDKEEGEQISAYKSYFTMSGGYMKLTVTLPVKPTSSNATSVSNDGKTLEWDLLNLGPDQNIHVEFSLLNMGLIIGICVVAAIVVLGIILALVLAQKKKKDRQIQNATGNYQQGGGYQPQGQYNNSQMQQQTQVNPQQFQPQTPAGTNGQQLAGGNGVADEIAKLKKLLDDGVITQEEFDAQKSKLLSGQ